LKAADIFRCFRLMPVLSWTNQFANSHDQSSQRMDAPALSTTKISATAADTVSFYVEKSGNEITDKVVDLVGIVDMSA
jgi:hypothetical protein